MVQHKNPCRPGRRKQGFLQHGMKAYVTGHASSHIRAPRQTQHLDQLTTRHDTWVTHHADGRSPGLCRARHARPIWVWAAGNITPLPRRIARWCVKPPKGASQGNGFTHLQLRGQRRTGGLGRAPFFPFHPLRDTIGGTLATDCIILQDPNHAVQHRARGGIHAPMSGSLLSSPACVSWSRTHDHTYFVGSLAGTQTRAQTQEQKNIRRFPK